MSCDESPDELLGMWALPRAERRRILRAEQRALGRARRRGTLKAPQRRDAEQRIAAAQDAGAPGAQWPPQAWTLDCERCGVRAHVPVDGAWRCARCADTGRVRVRPA